MSGTKLLSIIIPAYNAAKYVKYTVMSLQKQSYKDIEIIIINDGSTDNTANICEELAIKDCRIKVFNTCNNGVSYARNMGLKHSNGQVITFVDSDDTVNKYYFENLMNIYEKEKADCIIAGCNIIHKEECDCERKMSFPVKYKEMNKESIVKALCYMRKPYKSIQITSVWGKLYSRNLANRFKFNENMTIGEDFVYNFNILQKADKIIAVDLPGYNYFIRINSAIHSGFREKHITNIYELESIISKCKNFRTDLISRCVNIAIILLVS